ncbi:hypothetical protein M0804_003703 [Polistes exclamans]|nr:hypothetical protein M0804_003703 [Polistes exclamans]
MIPQVAECGPITVTWSLVGSQTGGRIWQPRSLLNESQTDGNAKADADADADADAKLDTRCQLTIQLDVTEMRRKQSATRSHAFEKINLASLKGSTLMLVLVLVLVLVSVMWILGGSGR